MVVANTTIVTDKTGQNKRAVAPLLSSGAYFDRQRSNARKPLRHPSGYHSRYYMQRMSPAQSRRLRREKPVKVHVHADMLDIEISDEARGMVARDRSHSGGGVRGTVNGFSRASRKRMIEFMAKVRNTGSMMFLTMTYDDTTAWHDSEWMTACFETFRRRFERAYPGWRAIWRKEHQSRKSGALIGTFVPHYHFIIFTGENHEKQVLDGLCEAFTAWGSEAWQEITGSTDENHLVYGFHATPVRSRKHAYSYVGKYVAKCENNGISTGRVWGRIGQFDTSASETFLLSEDEYIELRRLVKRWLKNRSKQYSCRFAKMSPSKGCTIFGLGDTTVSGEKVPLMSGYGLFIEAARTTASEKRGGGRWLADS